MADKRFAIKRGDSPSAKSGQIVVYDVLKRRAREAAAA
jgi:hypothetical protein